MCAFCRACPVGPSGRPHLSAAFAAGGVPPGKVPAAPTPAGLCPQGVSGRARPGGPRFPRRGPPAPSLPVRSSLLWWESRGAPWGSGCLSGPLCGTGAGAPWGAWQGSPWPGGAAARGTCRTWARSAAAARRRPSAGSRRPRSPGPACGTGTGTRGRGALEGPGSVPGLRAAGEPSACSHRDAPQCPVSSGQRPRPAPLTEACLGSGGQ